MKRVIFLLMAVALVAGVVLTMSVLPAAARDQQSCDNTPKTIHVKPATLDEVQGSCQSGYIISWQFVINQIDNAGDVPASIYVTWDNGHSANVTLWKYTGKTAHYQTTDNQGAMVTDATATIYGCWDGQFNLSDVTCGKPTPPVPEWPSIALLCTGVVAIGMVIYRSRRRVSA